MSSRSRRAASSQAASSRAASVAGDNFGVISIGDQAVIQVINQRGKRRQTLDEQCDELAAAIRRHWTEEARKRRLIETGVLPVGWHRSAQPLAGPVSAATEARDVITSFPPLPGLEPVTAETLKSGGDIADLHAVYGGLASGRLVIVGPAGSGKSAAAVLLLLSALAHRRDHRHADRGSEIPVPVLLTPHGWNPKTKPLSDWLAEELTHTAVFAGSGGFARARQLVDSGRIALILDGLDEVSRALRALMVQALAQQATFRLVLVTRSPELINAARTSLLARAAAVELARVTREAAADYLLRSVPGRPPPAWAAVAAELAADPPGPLSLALDNPLSVTLLKDTYPPSGEVDELLDLSRFPTARSIEGYLLDQVIEASYRPRLGEPLQRYSAGTARRALTYLAHRLDRNDTSDFGWWEVHSWVSARAIDMAVNWVISALITVAASSLVAFPVLGWSGERAVVGIGLGISSLSGPGRIRSGPLSLGASFRRDIFTRRRFAPGLALSLRRGMILGAAGALLAGVIAGLVGGPVAGIFWGFTFGLLALVVAVSADWRDTGQYGGSADPRRAWRNDLITALVIGAVAGIAAGAVARALGNTATEATEIGADISLFAAVMLTNVWWTFISSINLYLQHRVPMRLVRFLEDARERHVLRTIGPYYQFRHGKLQDRLAGSYQGRLATSTVLARVEATDTSDRVDEIIRLSCEEAYVHRHDGVQPADILLAILSPEARIAFAKERHPQASEILQALDVDVDDLRERASRAASQGDPVADVNCRLSPAADQVFRSSWNEAGRLGHDYLGSAHLLLGLLHTNDAVVAASLAGAGIDLYRAREQAMRFPASLPGSASPADVRPVRSLLAGSRGSVRRHSPAVPAPPRPGDIQLDVIGVRFEAPDNQPLILLREAHGERFLPLRTGPSVAVTVVSALRGSGQDHAVTDDEYVLPYGLLAEVLRRARTSVSAVRLSADEHGEIGAELTFPAGKVVRTDAAGGVALALWAGAPVHADCAVLDYDVVLAPGDPAHDASHQNWEPPSFAEAGDLPAARPGSTERMEFIGVRVEQQTEKPLLLLKQRIGYQHLPIWVSPAEALAASTAEEPEPEPTAGIPQAHNMFRDVLASQGLHLLTACIVALSDGGLISELTFSDEISIWARPGDAIALALRTGATILVAADYLRSQGVVPDSR